MGVDISAREQRGVSLMTAVGTANRLFTILRFSQVHCLIFSLIKSPPGQFLTSSAEYGTVTPETNGFR